MKFQLEIELGNDAMLTGGDVASALRRIADKLDVLDRTTAGSDLEGVEEGTVRDLNGNKVGRWSVGKDVTE